MSDKIKNGDLPAMPTSPNDRDPEWAAATAGGLTKREIFAMHAVSACVAGGGYAAWEDAASDGVRIADALLAELAK